MDEVVHYCTKCKLDLNHRIILVDDGVAKRVLCLTCRTDRIFRDRSRVAKSQGEKRPRRSLTAKGVAKKSDPEVEWRERLNETHTPPKAYSMDVILSLNDLVHHKLFGKGLVVGLIAPDKAQVFFPEGAKVLKCGPCPTPKK